MMYLQLIIIAIVAYLIGSIPTGYLVVKKLKGIDIRTTGSGSTGATNVKRQLGTKWFIGVMLIDAIKGFIATYVTYKFFDTSSMVGLAPVVASVAVILGHCKSIFLGFTGGKSVATGVGTLIALCPAVGWSCAGIWAFITFFSKYVSLGSVIALSLSPILMNMFFPNPYYIWYSSILAVFVVFTHKANIERLIAGTESKIGSSKKQ